MDLMVLFVVIFAQLLSHVRLFATPWTAAHQALLFFTISQNLLRLMSFESMMLSNHFIFCRPLLLSPSIFHNIKVFSNESALLIRWPKHISVQFSCSVMCPTLSDPMDCSTPGFPVHHQLLELPQTHVHQVGDAIQPSHPLSPPSPPAFNLSQYQGLFQ